MNFADAAAKILAEERRPLTVAEITRRALDQGLIAPKSSDAVTYVRAAIRKDTRRRLSAGQPGRFSTDSSGRVTLA